MRVASKAALAFRALAAILGAGPSPAAAGPHAVLYLVTENLTETTWATTAA